MHRSFSKLINKQILKNKFFSDFNLDLWANLVYLKFLFWPFFWKEFTISVTFMIFIIWANRKKEQPLYCGTWKQCVVCKQFVPKELIVWIASPTLHCCWKPTVSSYFNLCGQKIDHSRAIIIKIISVWEKCTNMAISYLSSRVREIKKTRDVI